MTTPNQEANQQVDKAIPAAINNQLQTHESQLLLTRQRFDSIKTNLLQAIEAMNRNHSMFARASKYWAEVPLWQKIVLGVGLIAPFFIIGIAAHLAVFLTISIYTTFSYTTSSVLLDNHHTETQNNTESLRKGVEGLTSVIGEVLEALGILREQLTKEIGRLHSENTQLAANVTEFSEQLKQLKETNGTLDESVKKQTVLLKQLAADLKRIDALNQLLKTQNQEWIATLTGNNKDLVDAYSKKLTDFLSDGTKSLDQLTTRISDAEIKLADTSRQLEQRVKDHEALLVQHRQLIEQSTELAKTLTQAKEATETRATVVGFAQLLERFGVNATPKRLSPQGLERQAGVSAQPLTLN